MRFAATLTTVALALAPLPVLASSCAQQIGTIKRRLDSAGAVEISGLQAGHALQVDYPGPCRPRASMPRATVR